MDQTLSSEIGAYTGVETGADVALDVPTPAPTLRRQAAETRRLYASDWADFAAWGRARQLSVLPAQSATVAAYLATLAATLSYGALARRAAAIVDRHRRDTLALPTLDGAARAVLRAARAARHTSLQTSKPGLKRSSTRRPAPPGPALLLRMAARCPGDLAGLRDRAMLALSAAGFAGERLLALDCEHVRFTAHGLVLAGPGMGPERGVALEPVAAPGGAGPSDQAGGGAALGESSPAGAAPFVTARLSAAAACPVRALERWLEHSQTRFGPVFRKVNRWGGIEHARLRPDAVRRIWQRRAAALRETPTPRASHRREDLAG